MHSFAVEPTNSHLRAVAEDSHHSVQFYETEAFLAGAVAGFVTDGVRSGEPVVIIATMPHRDAFAQAMAAAGVDVARVIRDGHCVMLDAEAVLQTFMVAGFPDWDRFKASIGGVLESLAATAAGKAIRAYGEMVDVLWRAGQHDAAIRLEDMWNELREHHPFSLLCAYVIDSFYNENGITKICATHSHVLAPERSGAAADKAGRPDTVESLIAEIARRTALERELRNTVRQLRHAEHEARRCKEDLEDLFANAVVPIHRVDGQGIIRAANAAELAMLGYRADEYIGHHIAEFHVDQPVIEDILERLRRGETVRDREARMRTKAGDIRIVQISSNVQTRDGGLAATRCFGRDVTELKKAEKRTSVLHAITLALSCAMTAEDAARSIVREALRLVDATAGGILLLAPTGQRIDRVFIDGDYRRDNAARFESLGIEADIPLCEAARSGNVVWVVGKAAIASRYPQWTSLQRDAPAATWGAVPIKFEDRTLGAIAFRCPEEHPLGAEDEALLLAVTRQCGQAIERARLHEAAQVARAEAEQASRAKDEFLAILGHELRNPLSPILTAVQLMRLRGETASTREQNVIERQVDHLIHIVDDLLDISRVARGKIQLNKRPVKLAGLLAKAMEIVGPLCEQRRHRINVVFSDEDIWIEADETRLCQVLTNLLSNAAKYTPPEGRIDVRVVREGERVAIHVKDNGNGITPDLLPRIFDLFVQGNRAGDKGGLGIGLALVRNLVRLHGGNVIAQSDGIGRGSELIVDLPTFDIRGEPEPAAEADWDLRHCVQMTSRRVLVVDDNEDAGALLAEVLRSVGHEVVKAIDGPRALEAVKRFTPDVAILDIGLPVMDGYELGAALRERFGPALRLIAVTGYGQEHDRARTAESGFQCHFVKPVVLQKVLAAIEVTNAAVVSS